MDTQKNTRMQAVKSKNTKLEIAVTRELWKKGVRFRKNVNSLFGKPDIAIKKYKIVIFIDSCFWHGCKLHCKMPQKNKEFWQSKIERNIERDREVTDYYVSQRWNILRIWEHELKKDFDGVINKALIFLQNIKNQQGEKF